MKKKVGVNFNEQIDKRKWRPILNWDEYEICENELENRLEDEDLKEYSKDKIREMIWEDQCFRDFQWECFIENLQEILERKSKNRKWKIGGKNLDWRGSCGECYLDIEKDGVSDAEEFIRKITPKCDFTLRIFEFGNELKIICSHHDCPTGQVMIAKMCSKKEFDENDFI